MSTENLCGFSAKFEIDPYVYLERVDSQKYLVYFQFIEAEN